MFISPDQFPVTHPDFEPIADDPVFDPAKHLALSQPEQRFMMTELGYGDEVQGTTPTNVAATSCFQVLSAEGVAAMQHVCQQLEAFTTSNARISRNTRGGVYRSRFLRDFSISRELCEHLSSLMETPLYPHTMPHQLSHLNYAPKTVGENVDKWHYDTLQADMVMFVTDPNAVEGGEFQYFHGTREAFSALKKAGQAVPAEQVIAPPMPGAGYAVMMQGNYVVHQAKALQSEGERITLVNGYCYQDQRISDFTALGQLVHVDHDPVIVAEYTRHASMRCLQQLQEPAMLPDYQASAEEQVARLAKAKAELETAIELINTRHHESIKHFGD